MPLSEHEQRILAEIERRLLEEDPKFAQQVGSSFQAHLARRLKLAGLGFVLGLVILVVGFIQNVGLGVAGFVVMLISIFEVVRTLRRRAAINRPTERGTQAAAAAAAQRQQRPPGKSGIEAWWGRMTERWRQRWEERGGGGPPP
jgi:flagellar biosynthesis/type III secretory pathway M-ring protein FliF/YscJ